MNVYICVFATANVCGKYMPSPSTLERAVEGWAEILSTLVEVQGSSSIERSFPGYYTVRNTSKMCASLPIPFH